MMYPQTKIPPQTFNVGIEPRVRLLIKYPCNDNKCRHRHRVISSNNFDNDWERYQKAVVPVFNCVGSSYSRVHALKI